MPVHLRRSASIVALVLLLAACGGGATQPPLPSQPASGTAQPSRSGSAGICQLDPLGCVEIPAGDPILVGTSLVISGPRAAVGLDSQYGAQVALNLRGPVLGHEVELVNQDDRCSTDGGTASANLLSEVSGLVAVIGTSCSSAAVAAAAVLGPQGILLVSPSNTAPRLTRPASGPAFYARTAPNDRAQAAAAAEFACVELAVRTAATIEDGTPYAEDLVTTFAEEFAAACAGSVTAQQAISVGEVDFSATLAEVATSNEGAAPELIYYPLATPEGALLTQQANATTGLEEAFLVGLRSGEDGAAYSDFLANAGPAAEGIYLSAPQLVPGGDFYEGVFLDEYALVSAQEAPIGPFHANAYDAVNLVLDAVDAVAVSDGGVTYVARTALRDALLATGEYQGLTGMLDCDPSGDCAHPDVAVYLVREGAFEPVWP